MRPVYLHGLHDAGGEHLMSSRPGWVVITEAIGANPDDRTGGDYSKLADAGFGVIVRLNHGYGLDGTIPIPERYESFARRVANFIEASRGCERWIVGNEPNHIQERPQGRHIRPVDYADCFRVVWEAVGLRRIMPRPQLITAAVAPWNDQSGDWCIYLEQMLLLIGTRADGIALHTGTHGASVELITSELRMTSPYQSRRFHFRAYQDMLDYVPAELRRLPVYITETTQGDDPWMDRDTGWVQAAYHEIDAWNKHSEQKIHCLALYRWSRDDQWSIQDKPAIKAAFQQAVAAGYRVPAVDRAVDETHQVFLPQVAGKEGHEMAGTLPVREWDPRLTTRGVDIEETAVAPGQAFWRVVAGEWYDEQAAGGRHHIYVEVRDEDGQPLVNVPFQVHWPSGTATIQSTPGAGFDAANHPMSPSRNEYSVTIADGAPSDVVTGIGMGQETPGGFNPGVHTATRLVFQRSTMPASTLEIPESPGETPTEPPVTATGAVLNPRVMEAVMAAEAAQPFDAAGRMTIRFETGVFLGRSKEGANLFRAGPKGEDQAWRPVVGADWRPIHTGRQADEYAAFDFALSIDEVAAYEAISMGAGQVMGFNFARAGYSSAAEMFEALSRNVTVQVLASVNYVLADDELIGAINRGDWPVIGERYNGVAAAGERYRAEYERLWGG